MNPRRLLSLHHVGRVLRATQVLIIALLLSAAAAPASAEEISDEDRVAARALFDKGRELMDQQRYQEACAQFDASRKLVRGSGILFKLAECYEKVGRTASAWINFLEVATLMREKKDESREAAARKRAEALKPKLSTLLIEVPSPVQGIEIRRSDMAVPRAQWGTAVPIDPGEYTIKASAPDHLTRTWKIKVGQESDAVKLTLSALAPTPEPIPHDLPAPATDEQLVRDSWIVGGVGIAQLAVAIPMLVVGANKLSFADELCPERSNCNDLDAVEAGNESRILIPTSLVLLGTGTVTLAASIVMFVLGQEPPDSEEQSAAHLGMTWQPAPGGGVMSLVGRF